MSDTKTLDAPIIRNIGDIEAAITHAQLEIGPIIWREAAKTAQVLRAEDWTVSFDVDDDELRLADRTWMAHGARKPKADFSVRLYERILPDGDGENSWLATFLASGPNGATMAFWIEQTIVTPSVWKKIVKTGDAIVAELRGCGFAIYDDDDRRLYIPVVLDREALARAFESDDFDEVMKPVAMAVGNVMAAAPVLTRLRSAAGACAS